MVRQGSEHVEKESETHEKTLMEVVGHKGENHVKDDETPWVMKTNEMAREK